MKRNAIASAAVVVVLLLAFVAGILSQRAQSPESSGSAAGASSQALVREDSHRLGAAGTGKVTFVEFLDFECESCKMAHPIVEDLRKKYDGKVDFVVRYFPLSGHKNSVNAAVAVEAAAQQGKFEDMYNKMYETQESWGEQQESKASVFRGFAQELGLDMAAYDKAVADPATTERVERDRKDGLDLGVNGTPTFFLNGTQIEPTSVQDFHDKIDAELNG
ncbi:DSBA oxidoreductase [Knoellia sinensis KCTC 19936]|uniref:DSBA oxidoreductase n=1 Tax=Knoellia sinensis KCTC 19936 TaxID=1385520 RepID=A0A0A0J5U1_9MICO|nr:thioredoxin domain-containing protein [Knoellia sinensis]KGN32134.1 DSBA oxidoreductase [Knoellia sinensis KCTC 19936]